MAVLNFWCSSGVPRWPICRSPSTSCGSFRAIVSEGSFKKAADSLYVTQPAVNQIQNLEKQLEVSLFDRGGRKAQLTEAGHLLLSYCDRILSQCHEACRALDDLHNLKGGSLIVGASQTTGP